MIGSNISHYKILSKLGEGGMGVVYKAEDTKLERTVALKFLAAHLLNDEEAKQRFLREAKAAAALHHPNICPVHEIDDADGKTFIAMALLEGESLEDRIGNGPLALKDAIDIGRQITEGLEAAHDKGVVHRDIKPANVMVDAKGRATIMDFGLARLSEASLLTRGDQTVGTAAYMSPDQLQGGEVDHRTDIWAVGCVLYEMVAGARAFKGEYQQALAYEIVSQEPEPLTGVRSGVPIELEFIVGKCLAKDAADRYQHANEIAVDLRTLSEKLKSGRSTILQTQVVARQSLKTQHPTVVPSDLVPKRQLRLEWGLIAGLSLLLVLTLTVYFRDPGSKVSSASLQRLALPETRPVGTGLTLEAGRYTAPVAISPNGKHIAYTSPNPAQGLLVHDLDQQSPRALEGTEGAVSPFWSLDSEFIGYATTEALFKIPNRGGLPTRLCELPTDHFHGGSFSPDGESIVFSSGSPHSLHEVPARGGSPERIVTAEDFGEDWAGAFVLWPHFLADAAGDRVLIFSVGRYTEPTIVAQDLRTGRREILGLGAFPSYSASGHILSQPEAEIYELWALPFSVDMLQPVGETFPVSQDSGFPTSTVDGTLVYLELHGVTQRQLVWVDRTGTRLEAVEESFDVLNHPEISPDGERVSFFADEGGQRDLWVLEMTRGVKTRLTNDVASEGNPVWSPNSSAILFSSDRSGNRDIYLTRSDGGGEVQALMSGPSDEQASDWSRDGKHIIAAVRGEETRFDIWRLERTESGEWESHVFLETEFDEGEAKLSPDGRYIAYVSGESGQAEIYVQPFPSGGRKVTVSTNGGVQPRWSRDGSELFYVRDEGVTRALIAASVSTGSAFAVNSETRLFENIELGAATRPRYDVSLDGAKFLLRSIQLIEGTDPAIRLVNNWYEEFRDRERH